ncbi:RluA family pseudouridine synthase [Treponema medium]|uniref:RluA family pseudouridine synthase n=1 Tax=Treponema medium TaxID=58231 RepID=UPI00197D3720|nr:RluA family pseudouridine synthase [Treponema medium]QSH93360.1 RluA family pseudouridine synthase [Treponema medium]
MNKVFELTVPDGTGKLRLDAFCSSVLTGMTRSQLKTGAQSVQLNGRQAKLSSTVQAGDHITLIWENPLPDVLIPEHIPIRIVYEDNDVIVVNKRAGMVTHPAAGNWTGTLVQALAYYRLHTSPIHDEFACLLEAEQGRGNFAELLRAGIVHRLDKDTSGILITARSAEAETFLKNEFKLHRTEKYYLAILNGVPEKPVGIIETSVFRDGHSRIRFSASADLSKGKYARSRYKVLRVYERYALVLFKIDTGRTHQVRLHARFIGCPIVGDPLYGKKEAEWKSYGLMLHAYRLCITLPSTQKKAVFTAPPPRKFRTVLRLLQTQHPQGNG